MKQKPKDKKSYNYCIPSPMAKFMSMIDDRTQMEASMLSMLFLLIGMMLMGVYTIAFTTFSWWFKGMTTFNVLCGFIFLFSYLITTFQQYQSLRETQEIVGNFGTKDPFPQTTTSQIKPEDLKSNN